uniref:RAD51_interact domain-containing protein n=1 Tax=Mesocestoides corti TaxID=53468 RepID=A0A5K3F5U6_MESCO
KRADEATSEESDSEVGWSKGSASEVSSHGGTPTRAAPKRRRTLIAPAASPSTPVPSVRMRRRQKTLMPVASGRHSIRNYFKRNDE